MPITKKNEANIRRESTHKYIIYIRTMPIQILDMFLFLPSTNLFNSA